MCEQYAWQTEVLREAVCAIVSHARLHDMYSGDGARLYHAASEHDNAELDSVLSACIPEIRDHDDRLRAVDLCAGSGRITAELSVLGIEEVIAVDISDDLLAILDQRALPNVTSVRSDAIAWLSRQPTDSLDIATIAAGSLRLFGREQRIALFSQLHRVLHAGGLFWFSHEYVSQPRNIFLPCEMNVAGGRLSAIFFSCPSRYQDEQGAVNGYWVTSMEDSSADLYLSWVRQIDASDLQYELGLAGFDGARVATRTTPRRMAGGRTMMYFSVRK
ncbi:class I SAM-dependent methyltransferase [Pseudoscardovia suis]|uniref:Methyltransferase domain-containing protein n=1 Tax=Pseudoscardovia suis TaxID=987063 RepID=A0A261F4H8_9BIFI|nr:class I SAM-dependent methyltransferase [Pseudoscardovia suis]OZG54001.1 hypothetical protein PSSU_0104 [Pseudoscardovia suis]PJJ65760.1 methyltransferase family protein [Pseudoscardovia suis]